MTCPPHTHPANGFTSTLNMQSEKPTLVTTQGEDRKHKHHQDRGYQLRWQKPRQDKHEENNLHHTRVHQDAMR